MDPLLHVGTGAVAGSPLCSPPLSVQDYLPSASAPGPLHPLPPLSGFLPSPVPSSCCLGTARGPRRGDRVSLAQGSQPRGSQEVFLLPILPDAFWCFPQCLFLSPGHRSQVLSVSCMSLVRRTPGNRGCLGMAAPRAWEPLGMGSRSGDRAGTGWGTEVLAAPGKPGSFPASHPP